MPAEARCHSNNKESKMKKSLDMAEVGRKVLEKNPYYLHMDKNLNQPATELTSMLNSMTVGRNFNYIPRSIEISGDYRSSLSVDLIGLDGEVAETIPSSRYSELREPELFEKEKADFKFTSASDVIVVAMVLREKSSRGTETNLILLSEPHTIAMMQEKRDSVVLKKRSSKIEKDMTSIEMLWGKTTTAPSIFNENKEEQAADLSIKR
jgi:phage anti-repressor protein